MTSRKQVMHLVGDQHPRRHPQRDVPGDLLQGGQCRARPLRGADHRQKGAVEPALIWRGWHLHTDNRPLLDPSLSVKPGRMFTKELGNDQGLADIGRPVQHHARHALLLGRVQQPLQPIDRLTSAGVVDPAVTRQRMDALVVVQCQHFAHSGMKVRERGTYRQISTLKASTGLS
jgi:hypothetical protein